MYGVAVSPFAGRQLAEIKGLTRWYDFVEILDSSLLQTLFLICVACMTLRQAQGDAKSSGVMKKHGALEACFTFAFLILTYS